MRRTAGTNAAFDAGRGCPFQCSFCTIINVQGRQSRYRTPDDIEKVVRDNWKQKISRFFITDDNFARNKEWEAIFDRLTKLREVDKIPLGLMIQVDTMCHKIPRFIEKAKKAGVTRVFLGLENINPDNLAAAKKKQNKITEYRKMMLAWKEQGIFLYAGYILGFPGETPESIRRDIEIIQRELPVDLLEFNILTPLPGSEDHKVMWTKGVAMDSDLNKYDLEHPVTDHPKMSRHELQSIYEEVWGLYYTRAHMETLLKRAAVTKVPMFSLAKVLVQFSTMMQFEKVHPLQSGLIRMKTSERTAARLAARERLDVLRALSPRLDRAQRGDSVRTMRWVLTTAWRIAHDPNRHSYIDVALTPIEDDEEETFDYLTKTDGAKAAIDHLKKVAELTHRVRAPRTWRRRCRSRQALIIDRAAVHHQRLAGDEIAVARGEEYQRAEQVFRIGVAFEGAAELRTGMRSSSTCVAFLEPGVAEDIAGRQRIDRDAVLPELARQRAGEGEHGALRGDVRQHARHALVGGAGGDVDDLAGAALDHMRRDMADHQITARAR